jgi:hypothetical protein
MNEAGTATTDSEEKIRRRAHQLWIEEGRPEGREREHWEKARKAVEDEELKAKPEIGGEAPAGPTVADPLAPLVDPPMKTKTAARKKPSFKSTKA